MTTIDEYSFVAAPIEILFNDQSLGHATGFVWKSGVGHFLVTNWHVVTAKNFQTGECLHEHCGRPNRLRALFNVGTGTFAKVPVIIPLIDEQDQPLWLIHPVLKLDVAVVPLAVRGDEPNFALYPITSLSQQGLSVQVGMDVFILGYPFGPEPPAFPVWKRGSIASEPTLSRLGREYFLVDTASRPGMSGAPVILRSWGSHIMEGKALVHTGIAYTRFIGIYSGRRFTKDANDAQLGLVWPASLVDQIIAANMRDRS